MKVLSPLQRRQLDLIKRSPLLDSDWYLTTYPDVAIAGMEPAYHYVWLGADLGRKPGPNFDSAFYLNAYPDVARANLNPLFHYVTSGEAEGRCALPPVGLDGAEQRLRQASYRVDKTCAVAATDDWLLFVAYCPTGRLTRLQQSQLRIYKKAKYKIALIVNSDDFDNLVDPGCEVADIQIVRDNVGFDFGAWGHAIKILGGMKTARSVTLTNDSVVPVSLRAVQAMRGRIERCPDDVLFLTDNREVQLHSQSYFVVFKRGALQRDALSAIGAYRLFSSKDDLIHEVEIPLRARFEGQHQVATLFPMDVDENPTIHHWTALLDEGFPFIKVQLVTSGILSIDDEELRTRLGSNLHSQMKEHVGERVGLRHVVQDRNVAPRRAFGNDDVFNEHGAQNAWNLPAVRNPTVQVPFEGEVPGGNSASILAIVHCFYLDIADEILGELAQLSLALRVLLTTDTADKAEKLRALLRTHDLSGEVVVTPNRGRDVAPFLIEGAKVLGDAEVILHLHTKKSPHGAIHADWGKFLRENLIGSRAIALSALALLRETPVGIVYSDHHPSVVALRNWGFDFEHSRALLRRMGLSIGGDNVLEFPTSTMFWATRDAIQPLFDLGLGYEDFEEEASQIDGTLAHAIERSILYIAESRGASFAKVTARSLPSEAGSALWRLRSDDLTYAFGRPATTILGEQGVQSNFCSAVPEVYPVSTAKSYNRRRRLNALIPTMKPEKIFGGITTAVRTIEQIASALPNNMDLRVIVTSDEVDSASLEELGKRLNRSFTLVSPGDDPEGSTLVGLATSQQIPLTLRAGDMFIATAWWTADLGFRLIDQQEVLHQSAGKLAYVIQDYEPGFYNWSNTFALAEATYHRPDETLAIINSEELANYLLSRYTFPHAMHIPYEPHPRLAELVEAVAPEPIILCYGRPSVHRNCFELLVEGLRIWQARQPQKHGAYEIVFAGEDISADRMRDLRNARTTGKMTIEEYAGMLSKSAVGVSLMVSPHPSYPPLEMALAGCETITNAYEGKDLSLRADNIHSLTRLNPTALADCLETLVSKLDLSKPKRRRSIARLPTAVPQVDYGLAADWLLGRIVSISSAV